MTPSGWIRRRRPRREVEPVSRRSNPLPGSIQVPTRWHRYAGRAVLALALALGVVCARSPRAPAGSDAARYHDRVFRVVRVVDADTLDIAAPDGQRPVTRIRLWGVDAPEIAHGTEPDMYFGPQARTFAAQTLTGRDVQVVLSPMRTRDKFGRLLAYVFLDRGGPMFNELLLTEGFAYADGRFDHHYSDRFRRMERQASGSGAGLWTNVSLDKMPPWRQRFERTPKDQGE